MINFASILLLIAITFASIESNSLPFCLPKCICLETVTNCSNLNLDRVPTAAAQTTALDLSFNKIQILNENALRHLSLLTALHLNDNRIEKLIHHLFAGLARLINLHLDNNRINSIDKNSFKNLHNLENLYLNDNLIEFLSNQVLSDLPSLQRIFLQNNRLTQISPEVFNRNKLLQEIRLENNAIICNCQLLWLKKFSEKISHLRATCDSPDHLKNKLIPQILDSEFRCNESEVSVEVKVWQNISGDQIILECKVERQSTIEWLHNDKPIDLNLSHNFYNLSNNGSKLLVKTKTNKIEGNYRCIARNFIQTISSPQKWINSSNNLSERKQNQIIQPLGSPIILKCHFLGPKSWFKNGNKIDKTLHNNRLNIAANGSLIIKNIILTDSAVYKCVDHLNKILESYLLKVSEPPVFIETPDSVVEVEFGGSVSLKCMATGFPEPQIAWTRRGKNIFRIDRMVMSLENIKTLDEDIYECVANNSLGIAVKEVKIKVKGGDIETEEIESNEILQSINEAREIVNQAINSTIKQMNDPDLKVINLGKLMKIARFPLSPESIEFAKSIEIYEKSLEIIRRKAEAKSKLPFTQFKYEELLSPNQLNILSHLSGCLIRTQSSHSTKNCKEKCSHRSYRTHEGFCNNMDNQLWGASLIPFIRLLPPQYEDGIHLPIGWFADRLYSGFPKPNARKVSQRLVRSQKISSDERHSHMLMQFGQFLDHDIDFSMPSISFNAFDREPIDCSKTCRRVHPCFSIEIPVDDIRRNTKRRHRTQQNCIELIRSSASCGSGLTSVAMGTLMAREQLNQLTAFIDGSNIYGSTSNLANHLRDIRDSGQMRSLVIDGKQYLPLNEARFPNDCQQDPRRSDFGCFLSGDSRANEQLGLLAMHTLWLREHNRIAKHLT